jgi:transposase
MGIRWEASKVYLALGATDMRKQINTLAAAVQERLGLAPFSGALFVFCNRRRTTLKILWWDRNGFCLWMRRLERDRFRWPEREAEVAEVGVRELEWLLDGWTWTRRTRSCDTSRLFRQGLDTIRLIC